PVPEQARLDMPWLQRLAQQRIRLQVDLADREVVGRAPPAFEKLQLVARESHGCTLSADSIPFALVPATGRIPRSRRAQHAGAPPSTADGPDALTAGRASANPPSAGAGRAARRRGCG